MPPIRTATSLNLVNTESATLANGIPVIVVPAGSEPICRIELIFDAGSRYQDLIFQASLTNQMIPEGTPGQKGSTIAEAFEYYGSYLNVSADRDEADITVHCLEKHLEPVLCLLSQVVREASFPAEELGIIRDNRIESMKVDEQRVESLARKQFNRLIFGELHPYGVIGEIPDIRNVEPAHLKEFHARFYTPSHCRILLTSPNPGTCLPILDTHFGAGWPSREGTAASLATLPPLATSPARESAIHRPEAVQTAIRIGKPLFNRLHPDFMGMMVVNTILGGYFGSRLNSNIREAKGYTYGISSHLPVLRDSGYFVIGSAVGAGFHQDAIRECFIEMEKLANDLVGREELELVRNYLTGQIQRSLDGPFPITDQLRTLLVNGQGLESLAAFIELANTITPAEIRDLAGRHLDPSGMKVVSAGPVGSLD